MDIMTVLGNVKLGKDGAEYMVELGNKYWFIGYQITAMELDENTPAIEVVNRLVKNDFGFEASKVAFFALDMTIPWKQIWSSTFADYVEDAISECDGCGRTIRVHNGALHHPFCVLVLCSDCAMHAPDTEPYHLNESHHVVGEVV